MVKSVSDKIALAIERDDRMFYELQPLRIQAGWEIKLNNFTEYDLSIHGEHDSFELNEDLLTLYNENADLAIDLGWYPQHDIAGNYVLLLAKGYDWNHPLEEFSSRSKGKIIACIEKWVCCGFWQKYQIAKGQ